MPLLFVLLVLLPLVELYIVIQVASAIGLIQTIGLMIVLSFLGAWLLKQQGMAAWRGAQESLRRGEMPTAHVVDGALILMGGALLLTPGFLTDAVGLLFLFPPTRSALKGTGRRIIAWWTLGRFGDAGRAAGVYREARVVRRARVDRNTPSADVTTTRPLPSPEVQGDEGRRPGEAGSPGMG